MGALQPAGLADPNPSLLQVGQGQGAAGQFNTLLSGLQNAGSPFTGLGKNGANNSVPAQSNPFQPGATNPFLTGELAPTTFDPFAGNPGLSNPSISTDQNNNLVAGPSKPAVGVGSLGRRRFQGRGGRRGLLGGRR
jgi:hypothetical protein